MVVEFDVLFLRKEAGVDISPSTVVLFQELERFNLLINKITMTIANLKKALNGEIGMNAELDDLSLSLFNGFLPQSWVRLAPQTQKQLGSWMNHFLKRFKQYTEWINKEPAVMWISGLHIPQSYLTALVQTTCRIKKWALDKSTLYTIVTNIDNPDKIHDRPEDGCYITGMYIEGAAWDLEKSCLKR